MAVQQKELKLQADCFQWRDKLWLMHHGCFAYRGQVFRIKNELDTFGHTDRKSRMQQLAQNNATGITKGIWDEMILREPMTWIEYKIPPNGLSQAQKDFGKRAVELGHILFVVTSLEQYKTIIYELLKADGYRIN